MFIRELTASPKGQMTAVHTFILLTYNPYILSKLFYGNLVRISSTCYMHRQFILLSVNVLQPHDTDSLQLTQQNQDITQNYEALNYTAFPSSSYFLSWGPNTYYSQHFLVKHFPSV